MTRRIKLRIRFYWRVFVTDVLGLCPDCHNLLNHGHCPECGRYP